MQICVRCSAESSPSLLGKPNCLETAGAVRGSREGSLSSCSQAAHMCGCMSVHGKHAGPSQLPDGLLRILLPQAAWLGTTPY